MEQWSEIRRRVLVEGVSRRQIIRETGMHWETLQKILRHSEPQGYRLNRKRPCKKLGPYLPKIELILQEDKALPRKQRHTAKRLWERLQAEGFTGGYTIVKDVVRELTQRGQEVFVPLIHRPGEAQVDFGEALVKMSGRLRKVAFMVMALPYSDADFVMAFERECTETFWEGHVQGVRVLWGRALAHHVRQHQDCSGADHRRRQGTATDPRVLSAQEPLPVQPSLLSGGPRQ